MDQIDLEEVWKALATVKDPILGLSIVDLGFVDLVEAIEDLVHLEVALSSLSESMADTLQKDIITALQSIGIGEINLLFSTRVPSTRVKKTETPKLLPGIKNVILVSSGKGGVGKSTVASNLAVAWAQRGARVGLLDADLYGPSIPVMMGIEEGAEPQIAMIEGEQFLLPLEAHNVSVISIGFFIPTLAPVAWRGPMIQKALKQFLHEVHWGELDYLILDLPPGTGDIQITLAQQLAVSGAVIVTTPQLVALADVVRGRVQFEQMNVPVLGLIENMSYFVCDDCETRHELFASGGGVDVAQQLEIPVLAQLPLVPSLRQWADRGIPETVADPDSPTAIAFQNLADHLTILLHQREIEASEKPPFE